MQVKEYKSLLWLSRWHNGQSLRLWQQLQQHHGVLTQLVLDELRGRSVLNPVELTICGIRILCEVQPDGIKLYSISPPETISGVQRSLFTLDRLPRQRERLIHFPKPQRNRAPLRAMSQTGNPDKRRGA